MHMRYLPPPAASAWKLAAETMPASPTNRQRVSCQSRRSRLTCATVVTSTVLPGNTQCRTGKQQFACMNDPVSGTTIAVMVNATPDDGRRDLNFAQEVFEALAEVVAAA